MSRIPPASVRVTCGLRDYAHVGSSLPHYIDQLKQYFALTHAWSAGAGLYFNHGSSSKFRRKLLIHACLAPMASGFRARRSFELMWAQSRAWYHQRFRHAGTGLPLSQTYTNSGGDLLHLLAGAQARRHRLRAAIGPGRADMARRDQSRAGLTPDQRRRGPGRPKPTPAYQRWLPSLRRVVGAYGVKRAGQPTGHVVRTAQPGDVNGANFSLAALRSLAGVNLSLRGGLRISPSRPLAHAGRKPRVGASGPSLGTVHYANPVGPELVARPEGSASGHHGFDSGVGTSIAMVGYDHIMQKRSAAKGPVDPIYGPRALVPNAEVLPSARLALTRTYHDEATLTNFCFVPGHYNRAPRQSLRLSQTRPLLGAGPGHCSVPAPVRGRGLGRNPWVTAQPRRLAQGRPTLSPALSLAPSLRGQAQPGLARVKSCAYLILVGMGHQKTVVYRPSLSLRL